MFQSEEPCAGCDKLTITVESNSPITNLDFVPSTYDTQSQKYRWEYEGILGYILIPRSFHGRRAYIDLYVCIDESDRSSIDIYGYTEKFLQEKIFSLREGLKLMHLSRPCIARPEHVTCRSIKYHQLEIVL
jgi:hypothetical protein